jgi:hypothetical protein
VFLWAIGDDEMGKALWHKQRNDAPQRDLLIAALESSKKIPAPERERLLWAAGRAVKLAENRNDLIHLHTTILIDYTTARVRRVGSSLRPKFPLILAPSPVGTPPSRLERVEKPEWKKSLRLLRGDYLALARYVGVLWQRFAMSAVVQLPRKPPLLSIPREQKKKPPKTPKHALHT